MAYLVYSCAKNKEIHISPLNQDYLDVTNATTRDLRDSRYVWLPLTMRAGDGRYNGLPMWSKVSLFWHDKWRTPPTGNGNMNQFSGLISQFEERNGEQEHK
ncbi:hypothetical protein F511_33562 [Dorcoceras hygrometricum]|uniref:Uncharacterized protein n=1 Tax=Dorcoceras hygrometricum TaxID=472368 RepID=A0A2Z7BWZ8_9LAMI|nr:hypothetical protein F511_33562 [Dorcoceras hygrometricum]